MNISGLPSQRCTWFTSISDDHTTTYINNYESVKTNKGLEFETNEGNIILIENNDASMIKDVTEKKFFFVN